MAYGNASKESLIEIAFQPYRLVATTKNAGATAASRIWAGNILVKDATANEGLQNAADTATFILCGIAADTQDTDAAAAGNIEIYPPGTVIWLPTIDGTVNETKRGLPAYVDYGASGTPQLVTTATVPTNNLGMVGVIRAVKTGYYLVDTAQMGWIADHANLNLEVT